MVSKPTLYYWPIRGRGEVVRLILASQGVDFDVTAPADFKTNKEICPFGQLPAYEDEDVRMCQSNAMIRYLGRKYKIDGATEADKVLVDMAMEGVESLRNKYVALIYQDGLSDDAKAAFYNTHISRASVDGRNGGAHLAYLEWFLSKGKDGFISSSGLTIGDLAMWDMVDLLVRIFPDQISSEYPAVKAFHDKVAALPAVAAYLASPQRPEKPNGNSLG